MTADSVAQVRIRPATDADREEVELLCVAALEFEVRSDARAYPSVLARRDAIQLVAVERAGTADHPEEQLVGTVIGSVGKRDSETHGYVELIAVTPSARRGGTGRLLLDAMEDAMREVGCRTVAAMGHPPWYAWPGVDVRYTPAICLFQAAGYEHIANAYNMSAPLRGRGEMLDTTSDEERLAAEGIVVRRLEQSDADVIQPWLATWGGTWEDEVLGALRHDPVRCHVAIRPDHSAEKQWLGFAAWGVNAPSVFGPMGTADAARGHGIGTVLLRRCLADQYVEEMDLAEIGWVGPHAFYTKAVDAYFSRTFWQLGKSLTQ